VVLPLLLIPLYVSSPQWMVYDTSTSSNAFNLP
jgi:hypothetical protein